MIPRTFHFVFGLRAKPEPLHLVHYLCLESCRQVNAPCEIYLHCHHQPYGPYWDMIGDTVTIVPAEPDPFIASYTYKQRVLNRYRYAHHADVIRLDALIEHGGIYADIDTIFVNPFPDALLRYPCVLGQEDDVMCHRTGQMQPSLCNAVIMAERKSPFVVAWRQRMYAAFDGSWSNHSGFLAHELSLQLPNDIHVEPQRTFYKHGFRPAGVQMLLEGLDTDFDGVISMHLWSHLWWNKRRRDFSRVHAGLITEDYVRNVDTTYTVSARRFLPPADRPRTSMKEAETRVPGSSGTATVMLWARTAQSWLRTYAAKSSR